MVLHLMMALATSVIAAVVLTVTFNWLHKMPALRLRGIPGSTGGSDHDELAWLLNHQAGQLLIRAAVDFPREDSSPAAIAFYRQLCNAWNEKHPDSLVTIDRRPAKVDQLDSPTSPPRHTTSEKHHPALPVSPPSQGRHQAGGSGSRHRSQDQMGLGAMPSLSP